MKAWFIKEKMRAVIWRFMLCIDLLVMWYGYGYDGRHELICVAAS